MGRNGFVLFSDFSRQICKMAALKTLCRPECFASVCFCFDSVGEGKPFEKRAVLVHFAA